MRRLTLPILHVCNVLTITDAIISVTAAATVSENPSMLGSPLRNRARMGGGGGGGA